MCSNDMTQASDLKSVQVGFVLISGPPGTGKSTLTHQLSILGSTSYISTEQDPKCFLPISYDDVLDKKLETEILASDSYATDGAVTGNSWKLCRIAIRRLVCKLAEYVRENGSNVSDQSTSDFYERLRIFLRSDSDDSETLSDLGTVFVAQIENNFIRNLILNEFRETLLRLNQQNGHKNCQPFYFLLIDDILYYESMRYDFYRFALRNEFGYFNCCLYTNQLDFLYERNLTRPSDKRLDERIIENIANKFECPDKIDWEKDYSLMLNAQSDDHNLDELRKTIVFKTSAFRRRSNELKRSLEEEAKASLLEQQLRESSEKNIVHESDLVIRKLISMKLLVMKEFSSEEKAVVARKLNANKITLLSQLAREKGILHQSTEYSLYEKLSQLLNVDKDTDRL